MTEPRLTIGTLADATACTVPTIRYYEQIGLLPRPQRAANGHRYYRPTDLKRLGFIKRCRDFGFAIEQVRELSTLFEDGDRACIEVRELAKTHLDELRLKLAAMRQLEASLAAFVEGCDATCADGSTRNCVIIEDIATPGGCASAAPACGAGDEGLAGARELRRT